MHELVIRGGRVIDGTGAAGHVADVAVDDGRIVEIGRCGAGRQEVDATDCTVAPGFIDIHTHLDVQGFWDPALTPSCFHGVTTVFGGNCGFTVAPLDDDAASYLMKMLARVEGMPLESLEAGVPWDWRSTAEYLDRLDGRLMLNAGFLVGHSALRRVAMGEEATERAATDTEIDRMEALLRDGLAAGGIGFSSSWGANHTDADGRPVPSRAANAAELIRLASVCKDFTGTSLEFLPGDLDLSEEAIDVMIKMSAAAQRPLNWNAIFPRLRLADAIRRKLTIADRASAAGAKVVGLALTDFDPTRFNLYSGIVIDTVPGWDVPMTMPLAERLAYFASSEGRRQLASSSAGAPPRVAMLANWGAKRILETWAPENKRYEGRVVADIAAERGVTPLDALLDIVCADELRTSFTNVEGLPTDEEWALRKEVWSDPRIVIGASDAGAHLDMLSLFDYATALLEEGVRKRGLLTEEQAVQLITDAPARLYGLVDRGRIEAGFCADIVVYDPQTVGRGPAYTKYDLPAGAGRLYKDAVGVEAVFVNGTQVVAGHGLTGAIPGRLLRSGRDTANPAMN